MTDKERLDWLEANHTLHKSVEILYVVDGYEVTIVDEDGYTVLSPNFHGQNLREAIDKAIGHSADAVTSTTSVVETDKKP